jgi:hypothetical protein
VLHELLTGSRTLSFAELAAIEMRHGIGASGVPELIARLTAHEPRLRPTAREAAVLLRDRARRIGARVLVTGTGFRMAPTPPVAQSPAVVTGSAGVPNWIKALGLAAATIATGAAVNRSTKTWDTSLERYRGSDGRFRGRGFFE